MSPGLAGPLELCPRQGERCEELTTATVKRPEAATSGSWAATASANVPALGVTLAILLLAYVVLGAAGAIVLVSTWILAAGLGRTFDGLKGPASWAGGVVGTFGILLASSALIRVMSPRLHGTVVNTAIIIAPAILGVCLLACARIRDDERPRLSHSLTAVPAAITATFLTVAGLVGSLGKYNNIAWAMSGDARNHVAIFRGILADGGVGISTFVEYPAGVSAFTAILAGAGDRSGSVDEIMLNDVRAMASTYILAAIAIGILTAAALLEIRRPGVSVGERISWPMFATLLVASSCAGTGFVLGMALDDGFLSAYGALPVSIAGVVLGLRCFSARLHGLVPFLFLALTVPLAFVSWTMIAIVPTAILVSAIAAAVGDLYRQPRDVKSSCGPQAGLIRMWWWSAIAVSIAGLVAIAFVVVRFLPRLEASFILTGSSKVPYRLMIVVLLLVAVSIAVATRGQNVSRQMIVPLAACGAGGLLVIWLVGLPGPGVTWTYYALKTNWLVSSSLLWLLFVPIVLWTEDSSSYSRARDRFGIGTVSVSLAVLMLCGSATTSQAPLLPAARGWVQPSSEVVEQAMEGASIETPFVFWNWSDPGNDRLGNFWGALAWGSDPSGEYLELPGIPGGARLWAYFAGGETDELCELVMGAPGITVYTRDDGLEAELASSCSAGNVMVLDQG